MEAICVICLMDRDFYQTCHCLLTITEEFLIGSSVQLVCTMKTPPYQGSMPRLAV